MQRALSLIGAPSSAGAYAPGQEKAPSAFRQHGLVTALQRVGRGVSDRGDTPSFRWRPDLERPKAMNLGAVRATGAAVAAEVAQAMADGNSALVLGGDCTVELGTVAGAQKRLQSVGLVYIDLDVDLNPPADSDGALDWTGVAHLLGLQGTDPQLLDLGSRRPMLRPDEILFFGAENLERNEAATLERLQIPRVRLSEIQADPEAAANRALAWADRFDALLVHLDVDVLSFIDFPIAENVRRGAGLRLEELGTVLARLLQAPRWRALTIAEVNPDHAPDEAVAFRQLIDLLSSALAAPADTAPTGGA